MARNKLTPFCCAYCGKGWSSLASLVGHVKLRHAAKLKDTTLEVKHGEAPGAR